jgi:L-rhamnose mutarotase
MGMVIRVAPDRVDEYRRLHAQVWPEVIERLTRSGVRNYSIFLREPENLLFGVWEYHGNDFKADMEAIASDPVTQKWWRFTDPCQVPLESRAPGEHWAAMREVFHMD